MFKLVRQNVRVINAWTFITLPNRANSERFQLICMEVELMRV